MIPNVFRQAPFHVEQHAFLMRMAICSDLVAINACQICNAAILTLNPVHVAISSVESVSVAEKPITGFATGLALKTTISALLVILVLQKEKSAAKNTVSQLIPWISIQLQTSRSAMEIVNH